MADILDINTTNHAADAPEGAKAPVWSVGGRDYPLRLKAGAIATLESKHFGGKNLLVKLLEEGTPALNAVLLVIKYSLDPADKDANVLDLYDAYVDEGGSFTALYTDVIIPLLQSAGFLTAAEVASFRELVTVSQAPARKS